MIARTSIVLTAFLCLTLGFAPPALMAANPSTEPAADVSTAGLDHLRAAMKDAYNRGDIDAMIRFLHPDVVIIFPDGKILKGRDAFRDYYDKMIKSPGHRVTSYSANPVVESRTVHNDVGLSYGQMNDHYVLDDGQSFDLNSNFTVTVFKSPDGPPESDGWMIRSFHSSVDAFDNPILSLVGRHAFMMAAIGSGLGGLFFGLIIGATLFRRRRGSVGNLPQTRK